MKKIIALLLAAVMVMCLFAGCASSGGSRSSKSACLSRSPATTARAGKFRKFWASSNAQLRQADRDNQWRRV